MRVSFALLFAFSFALHSAAFVGKSRADTGGSRISIAIVGDSMARGYCRGLKRHLGTLPNVSLYCWTKPSSGLTRMDFFDWNGEIKNLLANGGVDYAIVSMGANDAQDMTLQNRILRFSDPAWDQMYKSRVADMIGSFKSKGTDVYWVGMPMARSSRYAKKMARLNQIYAGETSSGGAKFISLWELTQEPSGRYTRVLPGPNGRPQLARADDGIHFNRTGERIVSCYILREMNIPDLGPKADSIC